MKPRKISTGLKAFNFKTEGTDRPWAVAAASGFVVLKSASKEEFVPKLASRRYLIGNRIERNSTTEVDVYELEETG